MEGCFWNSKIDHAIPYFVLSSNCPECGNLEVDFERYGYSFAIRRNFWLSSFLQKINLSGWRLALGNQRFLVRVRLLAMCKGELTAIIARLMFKCLWSWWKPVNRACSWKKTQIEKKKGKKTTYLALWNFVSWVLAFTCWKSTIRNTRKPCRICSKLTIKTPERGHWRCSVVLIVNFEHDSHIFLVFLLLTLNKEMLVCFALPQNLAFLNPFNATGLFLYPPEKIGKPLVS